MINTKNAVNAVAFPYSSFKIYHLSFFIAAKATFFGRSGGIRTHGLTVPNDNREHVKALTTQRNDTIYVSKLSLLPLFPLYFRQNHRPKFVPLRPMLPVKNERKCQAECLLEHVQ